jgi:hypothetical protein
MTTEEFNGYRGDLNGVYDVIYIGDNTGKFNVSEASTGSHGNTVAGGDVLYNDSTRKQKIYLHVGDTAKNGKIRSSGDDISSLRLQQLKQYVKGGNALVLANDLSGSAAASPYKDIMDTSSNMHKLINSFKSGSSFTASNICALKKLNYTFLYNNTWMYSKKLFSLPVRGKTSLTSEEYKAFQKKYAKFEGRKYYITSSPVVYDSDNADGTTLTSSTLDFSFYIGDKDTDNKYAVRIYMDTDYDGIISDNSHKSELVYDSNDSGTTYSYSEQEATDDNGVAYKDRYGDSIMVPKTYTISFDFAHYYSNRKLLARQNGSLAWRFEVYSVDNEKDYISKSGTSRYHSANNDKNTINALQVVPDDATTAMLDTSDVKNSLFNELIGTLADYTITVKSVKLSDFIAGCSAEDYFDSYTMLIVSCGAQMQNQSADAVAAVTQQAKDGLSVLYTGDPLSKDSSAEDTVTSSIKDVLNLSRFTDSDDTYRDENKFNGKTDKQTYSCLEYSYAAVMEEGNDTYPVFSKKLWNKENVGYGNAPSKADGIAQTNNGGITNYPFTIDEKITISGTTAQDYQLNMDNANLSVWYTLGALDSDEADNTLYGISPKDAANNYYLYTVDNVGYIGIDLANSGSKYTDEMKLFIDTIVGLTGYKNPYVDVSAIEAVTADKKDGTLSLVEDNTNRELGLYFFNGELPTSDEDYLDYGSDDTGVSSNDSTDEEPEEEDAPAEETTAPTASPAPEVSTPEPTVEPEPEEDPYTFKAEDGVKTNYVEKYDSEALKKFTDDAVVCVKYNTTGYDIDDNYQLKIELNGSYNYYSGTLTKGEDAYLTCTLGELRKMLPDRDANETAGANETADSAKKAVVTKFGVYPNPWSDNNKIIISVVVYASQSQMESYKNSTTTSSGSSGGTGSSSSSNQDQDTSLVNQLQREEVTGDFAPEKATHKISFIPYDGNVTLGNIRSFKITLVNDTDETTAKTKSTIKKIYRDYTDAVGEHTWMYKASADGTFTIKDLNFVQDSLEYYFFYDDHFAQYAPYYYKYGDGSRSTDYHYVKFDISNKKKSGTTYLDVYYGGDPDSTYVFQLD